MDTLQYITWLQCQMSKPEMQPLISKGTLFSIFFIFYVILKIEWDGIVAYSFK